MRKWWQDFKEMFRPIDRPVPGHTRDDPACVYWMGDFAGVRLTAKCEECRNGRS